MTKGKFLGVLPALMVLAGCVTQPPAPTVERTPPVVSTATVDAPIVGGYTVKRGDTLFRIAKAHGVDLRDLAAWNGIANPESIKEGQVLRVKPPGAEVAAEGVSTRALSGAVVESRSLDAAPAAKAPPSPADNSAVAREPKVGKLPYSDEALARLNGAQTPTTGTAVGTSATTATQPTQDKPVEPAHTDVAVGPDDIAWSWPSTGKMTTPFSDSGNKGVDIAGKAGDPVLAAADGKVVYAGSGLRGYGELVIIKHSPNFLSAYAHNRKILVKEGQSITRGQKVAEMGNTDADAVKLHFEIRRQGKPTDPLQFLPKR